MAITKQGTFEPDVTASGVFDRTEHLASRFEVDIDCRGLMTGLLFALLAEDGTPILTEDGGLILLDY